MTAVTLRFALHCPSESIALGLVQPDLLPLPYCALQCRVPPRFRHYPARPTSICQLIQRPLYCSTLLCCLAMLSFQRRDALAAVVAPRHCSVAVVAADVLPVQIRAHHPPPTTPCLHELRHCVVVHPAQVSLHHLRAIVGDDDNGIHVLTATSSSSGLLCEIDHSIRQIDMQHEHHVREIHPGP